MTAKDDDDACVQRFQEFIRIPSISGEGPRDGSYARAVEWLKTRCLAIEGVTLNIISPVENKPIVIAKLEGSEPELPCIVLNSHYDVVPVMREHWSVDPFAAEIRDGYGDGPMVPKELQTGTGPCVFGRGAQDMKCVCCQYLEALRRLVEGGWRPRRTVWLTFVPDEETGGTDGMGAFLETEEFKAMGQIALALDEGLANPRPAFTVFYGERTPWWLLVRAQGPTGHGSRFIANTAVSKLMGVVTKALDFRKQQETALGWNCEAGCKHAQARKLGDVTTLNVTMLKSGVSVDGGKTYALNVIPTEAEAGFDVRICPSLATADFKRHLDEWCSEEGLSWRFAPWTSPLTEHHLTDTDRATNPFFGIFEDACASLPPPAASEESDAPSTSSGREEKEAAPAAAGRHPVEREIFPAGTDSRFLRALGVQAVGFSPMAATPMLLHEHDEALSVATFLKGVGAYQAILFALADAPASVEAAGAAARAARANGKGAAGAGCLSAEPPFKKPRAE